MASLRQELEPAAGYQAVRHGRRLGDRNDMKRVHSGNPLPAS
jgi:hypothetical protein